MTVYEYREFSFPFDTRPGKDKEVDFLNKIGSMGWKVHSHYLNGVAGGSDKTIYITAFKEIDTADHIPISINQEVSIIPISQRGTIIEIRITEGQPVYVVEYWWEGKLQVANVSAKDIVETRK
jgi:hypothetical protein